MRKRYSNSERQVKEMGKMLSVELNAENRQIRKITGGQNHRSDSYLLAQPSLGDGA
jgi:hypothetical protein